MKERQIFAIFLMVYGIVTTIVYMANMAMVSYWTSEVGDYEALDYSTELAKRIDRDWQVKPFTDIIVTADKVCPESHPDLVFYRTFMGTDVGCNCLGIEDDQIYKGGNDFFVGIPCGRNETKFGCENSEPLVPTIMGQVNGQRVCG